MIMYCGFLLFISAPILELLGHALLANYKRRGMCDDQSAQELLGHENSSVVVTAVFVLLTRALLLLSMVLMAWAFLFLRNSGSW